MAEMSTNADDAEGRVEEAAGAATGDQDLQDEGGVDQAAGAAKAAVDAAADKVKGIFDRK